MAGETVFVVDDDSVNLKLVAAVLRSEAYRVHLFSTAEQALMALRTTRPDLMLVDLRLPGIDGLEFTRQVRATPRTHDVRIVALTASTSREVEANAYEAGCDGFITKPFDTRSLPQRLRAFLEAPPDAPMAPVSSLAPQTALNQPPAAPAPPIALPDFADMRRSFIAEGTAELRRLMALTGTQFSPAAASHTFHQWIGSAGALGCMEIAECARAGETLLGKVIWTQADLQKVLAALLAAFTASSEAADKPIPDAITGELNRKRIALVGFADAEADKVCATFEKVRALPLLFSADEPPDSEGIRGCAVVMVHVRAETLSSPWLQPGGSFPETLTLVLVGTRDVLMTLDRQAQTRASEYLIDGWQPEEVVMRLSFAISRAARQHAAAVQPAATPVAQPASDSSPRRAPGEKPRILIADDDDRVMAVVVATLRGLGFDCHPATNGIDALRLLRELRPHAAVLDVNMPGMDGFEVLSAIRKDAVPLRIVMLTARQQEVDVVRGFSLGADDYIVKPFSPVELAARLRRLL